MSTPPRHLRPVPEQLEELLLATARGDESAFAALYDRIAGRVYGLAVRVLTDPAQAEETTQEAMLEIWRKAPRFDPDRGSALAWTMTIAHRRAVDRVRSEEAARARSERAAARRGDPPPDEVAEIVEIRDERRRVAAALDGLTAIQREAVTLAYYEGHTYREVADRLGVPLGTVKTRMRDGLQRLRRALEAPP